MTIMALSRIHLIIISATIALLLNACSQQTSLGSQLLGDKTSRAIALTPLKKIENPIPTHKNWQVKTGRGMGENKIHPFFTDKIIFVASVHSVSAWNKDNGTLIWKRAFGEAITAGINGDLDSNSDQIVIGSNKGNAIALDAKTGKIRWVERLSSEILAVSPSKNGFIALRTVDGKIHGLSSQTGEIIWQRSQRTPKLSHFGASVPVIIDANVISGFDNGKLVAYQLSTGKTGNPVWLRPFSTPSGLSASTKTILARDNQGNIWKFDPQTGNPIWKMDDLKLRQPTLPVIINSELAITADKQGKIHWINTKTGKVVARDTADKTGYAVAPIINRKAIYLIGKSGLLTKFSQ